MNKKKLVIPLFLLFVISLYLFNDKTYEISRKIYLESMTVRTTYYCPKFYSNCSDKYSGCVTKAGANVCDLRMDHSQNKYPGIIIKDAKTGWYFYRENGVDYLIIATDLRVHPLGNRYTMTIHGTTYNAIVLDECGACTKENGKKVDIFTSGSAHLDSSILDPQDAMATISGDINANYSATPSNNDGTILNNNSLNISTSYTGNIKNGYIYNRFIGKFEKWNNETKIINEINDAINEIYSRAFESTTTSSNIGTIITDPTGGDYSQWKQCNSPWSNIKIGNSGKSVCEIGCLVTSIAIQIKRSGTIVTVNDFNPGNFINELNSKNGFVDGGNFAWRGWEQIAPHWYRDGANEYLPASWEGKVNRISELLQQGYYPVMCVKAQCKHWVAVTGVVDNNIIIIDPGYNNITTVLPNYQNIANDSTLKVAKLRKYD